jgi:cytochrome P450
VDELDLLGPHFQADPQRLYEELRAAGAVHHLPQHGWYLVTHAGTAREVLRDAERFSSRVHKHTEPPPEVAEEVARIRSEGWPYVPALGTNDPPNHTRLRKLVQRAFTARSLEWMEPLVRQTAEELAAALPDGAEIDFLKEFAEPLPVWAISRVLGLPESRRDDIRRWSVAAAASIGGMPEPQAWIDNERTLLHYQQTMAGEIEDVRRTPREGLLTTLVQAADAPDAGEEPIPMAQLLTLLRELVIAGNETSGKLITEIVRLLAAKSDEWDRLRAEPDRAKTIVEEALRWASPSQTAFRRATRDTELAGVEIPAGAVLVVSFASANRDEDVFPEAARFDPDRAGLGQHLAFGLGMHACIGNPLARMEAVIATQVLASHVESLTVLRPQEMRYNASFMVRGLVSLPVLLRRRTEAVVPWRPDRPLILVTNDDGLLLPGLRPPLKR